MSLFVKCFLGVVALIGGYVLLAPLAAIGYIACCTTHHRDATELQRNLEALPGVIRAEVSYSKDWLEWEGEEDDGINASIDADVELDPDAPTETFTEAMALTSATSEKHADWDSSLTLEVGDDRLSLGAVIPQGDEAMFLRVATVFEHARDVGRIRSYLGAAEQGYAMSLDVVLPDGSTWTDLHPAYEDLDQLVQTSGDRLAIVSRDLIAADGSGFTGGATAARWAELRRLQQIKLPGADLAVHLGHDGEVDLVVHPRPPSAPLDEAAVHARLTPFLHRKLAIIRERGGHSVTVWFGDLPVAEVDLSACHRGLTPWDDELNQWFWAVDCSQTGVTPPTTESLDWRYPRY